MSRIIDEQNRYFESWKGFLEASTGQKILLSPELNRPWLILPNHYDQHYLTIEGHEILGWGEDLPYVSEYIKCDGDRSVNCAAVVESGRALQLLVDPRTVRYVQQHDGRGEDSRPNPGWLLLRAIESFFKDWKKKMPERLEKVFMGIKEERLNWLDNQIRRSISIATNLEASLKETNDDLVRHRRAQIALRHISSKHFTEAADNWHGIIDSIGELSVIRPNNTDLPTALRLTMPDFELEGVTLGPYRIDLDLSELTIKVENTGDTKSWEYHHHPHVDTEGNICWGDSPRTIIDVINRANPLEILFCVADFLKTSYTPGGSYCRLENWERNEDDGTWYCEHCDCRHDDDNSCPQWCGECEQHTRDWSEHHTCNDHYECWEEGNLPREHRDEDAEECPECRKERIAEEEEARAEEEAEEQRLAEEASRLEEEAEAESDGDESEGETADEEGDAAVSPASDDEGEGDDDDNEVDASPSEMPPPPQGYDNDCSCVACEQYRQVQDQTAAE
jgi:hypothetical protein